MVNEWTLTEEHEKQIPAWNKKWEDIILSTEPMTDADRKIVYDAIFAMYKAAFLRPPADVVFVRSPLEMSIVGTAVKHVINPNTPNEKVKSLLQAVLAATGKIKPDVGDTDEIVWRMANAAAEVVNTPLADLDFDSWHAFSSGGNHGASWCCFLSFVRDVVGWKDESHEDYYHFERAAIHGSWRYMHEQFCVVADRPSQIHYNEDGESHNDAGPAISWRDGTKAWKLNGVEVDEQIVMRPETQTLEQIRREFDNDVQQIRVERFGWERYLIETNAKVIDKRINDIDGTTEALLESDIGLALLCVCRSTGRRYALAVPAVKTCEEAQAWLSGGLSRSVIDAA